MAIAFFDLDRTLLSRNSGSLWVRSELEGGHISRWQALKAGLWITRYHLGVAEMEEVLLRAIQSLKGQREEVIRARTRRFYEAQVRGLVRPGALEVLEAHRARGDTLALLTSSSNYLSEAVGEQLGIEALLCNRFEVDGDGLYTGQPLGPLCYGEGKLTHARALAQERGVDLRECSFYTDSVTDLPVMLEVGQPVAVHPDPRLKREAQRRGWPIVFWGE